MHVKVNEYLNDFLGKIVDVGIPHRFESGKLFFLTGEVLDIQDGYLILRVKNGVRRIPFSDLREISINHKGWEK
jgi:hypothetical protein